ncbi:arrestin domain-containing protein [Aspergillus sclerotiicarbonarius CBS 121057]|uniref:Arrestin domain-containing protein n=1 Tax=Aspergillus sclerotiicarbonarius (strain CBS 121057 / IBT 28362) TaxID=1448318 RepID=A0A319F9W8_ASPSB|nr:arrestin domain-containing protein [Aspergillus sclerotiicarbonarius CBS 121057]
MISNLFRPASPPQTAPTYFDIRLDSNVIWLPGDTVTTEYHHLKGNVILCLNQPLCVKDMKLHFEGRRYIKWDPHFPHYFQPHPQKIPHLEHISMRQTWNFLRFSTSTSDTLPPGNHEFPFHFCLSNKAPDSIQGLADCYIKYHLKAQIRTPRGCSFDFTKQIRVCRMYRSLVIPEPSVLQNIWPDKIIYRVQSPSNTFTFDSAVPISFHFVPLRKALKIASIHIQLTETHKAIQPALGTRSRIIIQDNYDAPDWDGFETISDDEGFWYYTTHLLRLPKGTKQCLQSTSNAFLRVDHTLNIQIRLLNPEGHESAIDLTWHVFVCLPFPSSLADAYTSSLLESARMPGERVDLPLPCYRDHVLDRTPDQLSVGAGCENVESQDGPPDYLDCEGLMKIPSYSTAVGSGSWSPVPFCDDDDDD